MEGEPMDTEDDCPECGGNHAEADSDMEAAQRWVDRLMEPLVLSGAMARNYGPKMTDQELHDLGETAMHQYHAVVDAMIDSGEVSASAMLFKLVSDRASNQVMEQAMKSKLAGLLFDDDVEVSVREVRF